MTHRRTEADTQRRNSSYEHKYGFDLGKTIARYEEALETKQRALTLDAQGNWREALGVLATVKEIQRQAFNGKEDEPHVPQLLHNIGVAYASQGEYQQAIDAYRSSLDLQRKLTGDMHAGVASALMNLGNAFQELQPIRLDRSQFLYEKALEIRHKILDSKDPLIADTLHQLALTHEKQAGRRDRRPGGMMVHRNDRDARNVHHSTARALYCECLHLRVSVLGDSHVDTTATLFNLGLSMRNACIFRRALWTPFNTKRNAMEMSRNLLSRALASMETSHHFDQEDAASCLQYLATVECEFEQWEVAMDLFVRQFNSLQKLFLPGKKFWTLSRSGVDVTPKKGLLGEALCGKAMCLIRLNQLPEGLKAYEEALKILNGCILVDEAAANNTGWGAGIAAKMVARKIKSKAKRLMKGRIPGCEITKRDVGPRIMGLLQMAKRCRYATKRRIDQIASQKMAEADSLEEKLAEERRLRLLRGDKPNSKK